MPHAFFDDPGKALQQMEDELLEEDWEEDEEDVDGDGEDFPVLTRRDSRPTNYAVDFDRTVYDDEETDDAYYAEDYIADRKSRKKQRKKGSGGLVLLLLGNWPVSPASSGGGQMAGAEDRRALRPHSFRADAPWQRLRGADRMAVRAL